MPNVLLDRHVWAWAITGDRRLPAMARERIASAEVVFVSPISFFEIGNKVRLKKWVEMAPSLPVLTMLLAETGGRLAALTPDVALLAASLDWPHRDPFDRMIAASAIRLGIPLVSVDAAFDGLAGHKDWPGRIW